MGGEKEQKGQRIQEGGDALIERLFSVSRGGHVLIPDLGLCDSHTFTLVTRQKVTATI